MSDMALEIARMIDMLPEEEQRLAYEIIKRFVIAWDPDFTKLTPEEARQVEEAELSGYVDEGFFDGGEMAEDEEVETISKHLMEHNSEAYRELSVYDKIKTGLEEAIAFERGELSSHTRTLEDMRKEAYEEGYKAAYYKVGTEVATRMIQAGVSFERIADIAQLSLEEVENIAATISS